MSPTDSLDLIVVMIDLDDFKQLNDTYGHLAGDQALTAVGWVLRQNTSGSAIVGRFGGEEFVVIDAVEAAAAEQVLTRLCAAIASLPQPVTASIGAAVVRWAGIAAPAPAIAEAVQSVRGCRGSLAFSFAAVQIGIRLGEERGEIRRSGRPSDRDTDGDPHTTGICQDPRDASRLGLRATR